MRQTSRALLALAVALAFITTFSLLSYGQTAQPFLTRHVPEPVLNGKAQLVGALPANQTMRFDIVIPLRDQPGLDLFLQDLYNPASPFYHLFITPEEFTARFGASEQDWEALVNFAKASGFQIFSGTRDERDLRVTGTVANIEKAFHVALGVYQHPTENRTFFSPDREPSVDLPFPLWHVSGLDNYITKRSMLVNKYDYAKKHGMNPDEVVKPDATTGSGPSASFLGSDMRHAYYCNGTCGSGALTGTGQTVGLFEYEGTDLSDLTLYYKNAGQTEPFTPTIISVDGTSTTSSDDIEQTLDMTQAMGMAPGITMLYMYVGSTDTAILSAMVATADAPLSKQIGCSWGWTADVSTLNPYFEQMGTQDQNFFAASGDSGYWHGTGNSAPWPADDAYLVGVGGTDLTTSSAAGPWATETSWSDSGGGITTNSVPIPSWQQLSGVINSSNAGSTTLRNGPDVSANANFTFYTCGGGSCTANEEGGTSFAAPMWAGYLALANQQAAANGEVIGFINPTIYPANLTSSYGTYFHDITSGSSNGKYSPETGFDLITGWGSPNGSGLINLLAPAAGGTTPQTITVTPAPPSSAAYQSTFGVAATASSGLAVAITTSGSCTGSGTSSATITMSSGTGTCSVIFNQAGNATYAAAPTVTDTTTATTLSQTISWTTAPPASAAYYSTFNVAATASSGLAVTIAGSGECSGSGSSGSATITMNATSGTCTVTASQAGSTNYSAATSLTPTVSATQATQTITFTTNPPSSEVYNGNFTVAATATSSLAVTYTSSGSCSNSGATYTMTSGTGTCSVIANQSGNTYYSAATPVTKTVNATLASQTITFTTNPPSSEVYNGNFTVAATGGASGNSVVFTSSGSCSNSGATYTMTSGTGTCSVTANQAGNTNYAAATPVTKTVNATLAPQTITFTTPAPASAEYGSSFIVAATGGASGNSVVFTSSGSCSNSGTTYTMTSGTGNCSVIANQAGTTNYSAAPTVTETTSATLANASVGVGSSSNPSLSGQSVTFTATITSDTGAVKGRNGAARRNGAKPMSVTGSVTWSSNTGCSASTVSGYPGTATCTTSTLAQGTDTVTATYAGDSNHTGGTGTLSGGQVVNPATKTSTTTTVASTLNPSIYGQAVSFTAAVTGSSPTGTVQFNIDGSAFGSPVTLVSGTAISGSTSTLAVGTHTVTAVYSGDTNNSGSTGTLAGGQTVNTAGPGSITVGSSLNPSAFGQSVTFTATIPGDYGQAKRNFRAKPQTVTGNVTWSTNTGCGTTPVTSGNPGTATCTTSSLSIGTDTITATYNGDSNHNGGTATLSSGQIVNQAGATTTVASSLNPAVYGQAVSFTATVTGSSPTGTVQFNIDGGAFGSPVTLVSGTASSTSISTLAVGTHAVTAVYSGDVNNSGSTGALSGGEVVNSASTGVSVGSSLNPSIYGESVTFTATINAANNLFRGRNGRAKPMDVTGNVAWSGNTGCGSTPVTPTTGTGTGTATCTASSLAVGTDAITATYSGDSNHNGGTGTLSGGQVVSQASQTITFTTSAPSSAAYNSSFTVAATASSGLTVAYTSAGSCSNSGATYTMTSGTGTCFVIANQAGNAGYAAAPQVTENVNATLAAQTITVTVPAPPTATYHSTFTVGATGGGSGNPITFASAGACTNSGATYTISKSSGTCTGTLTQAGNANYAAATPVLETTTVAAAIAPTVSVTAPATAYYQSTFTPVATTNASTTAVITVAPATVCTISGGVVTMASGTGTCTVTAKWAADDVYKAATATAKTTAEKVASGLTWATPAPITHGTLLSSVQLDATANVSGTFVYSPAAGTEPKVPTPPATCDTLKVTFTPAQTADYTKQTATVCLVVTP